jgi:hypothetical protein
MALKNEMNTLKGERIQVVILIEVYKEIFQIAKL